MEKIEQYRAVMPEEKFWLDNVYQGDTLSELTYKVFAVGTVLSLLLISSNIYMGLKTGITMGGSLIGALLAFVMVKAFRGSFSILENNNAQTMASASASLGIMVSTIPALIMLGYEFSRFELFIWILFIHIMGVLFTIPLRMQFVVIEKLTFPSGTACAETIRAMHAHVEDAVKKARVLGITGLISGIITWFRDGIPAIIPMISGFPGKIWGYSLARLTLGVNWSPMLFGVGFLVGPRIGTSLLLGAIIGWGILAPFLANAHIIEGIAYPQVRNWTMWSAIALMVTSAILSLILKAGTIFRAFRSMKRSKLGDLRKIDISFNMWLVLFLLTASIIAIVMQLQFHIPVWLTVLAIIFAYMFSIVAVRTYGETDINPVGAMGYGTQIIYGGLAPGNMMTNVMAAGITASGANQSADMMQDYKTGYLLGATPKKQTIAQLAGVFIGSIAAVPIFYAVIGAYGLASDVLPAPSAVTWVGMAEFLSSGFSALPSYAELGILCGILLGIILTTMENSKYAKITPSPFGIGI
ncbi:MAG: OPT/YSL family transporter, partial [Calditrichia bacterium]